MTFTGFTEKDFHTFQLNGLAERMTAIQERIQPKFNQLGSALADDLSALLGQEMFLHIARHARRKVNPPNDTWLAVANNKRGYKQHPHFQVGLFDDHLFIWLAFIYELPRKKEIAQTFLNEQQMLLDTVPSHYVVSLDHLKKHAEMWGNLDVEEALERFRDVKKAEFLIGRHIGADDPILTDGAALYSLIKETFQTLLPVYQLAYK